MEGRWEGAAELVTGDSLSGAGATDFTAAACGQPCPEVAGNESVRNNNGYNEVNNLVCSKEMADRTLAPLTGSGVTFRRLNLRT